MSTGTITLAAHGGVARVTLAHPGKRNAIDIAMWQALRRIFEELQALPPADAPRAVIVQGSGGCFASGGDIAEFQHFRFDAARLQHFHEGIVAPALLAVLDCDLPVYAQIEGACVGGGLELAACCDIRICGGSARFGAPIGKLGFPMAPLELQLLHRVAPAAVLREMLLEARFFDADQAMACGLVHAVVADADLPATLQQRAEALRGLSPQAARINKRSLRQIAAGGPTEAEREAHFAYAPGAEHREGIAAFVERRAPRFDH